MVLEEAHQKWQEKKVEYFDKFIKKYEKDKKIINALCIKIDKIIEDIKNKQPTIYGN